jgi:KDO2-lipid IV(A) lauroyltransferase
LVRSALTYSVYRLLLAVLPHVPRRAGLALFARVGRLYARLAPDRGAVRSNLAHVLGPSDDGRRLARLVPAVYANQARNYFDMFHFAGRPPAELDALVDLSGAMPAVRQLANTGAVAVTMHYGNLDVVAQMVARAGVRVVAVVERLQPPALFDLVCSIRARTGLELIPIDTAPLHMFRALRSAEFLVLAADRNVSGGGVAATFFGREAELPDGYARLALRAAVPLCVVHAHRLAGDRFALAVRPVAVPALTGDVHRDVRAVTGAVLAMFEPVLAEDPSQWVLFRPVWPDA